MRNLTLYDIADELNERARTHPIGALQEIRGHRPGNDLFRANAQTTQDGWACHWGGRTELQFNIGLDGSSDLRHGVAFDFSPSRSYTSSDLVALLKPKVTLFNKFVRRYPKTCANMVMWAIKKGELVFDGDAGPIPQDLIAENIFVFLGKVHPIKQIDYDRILHDFDDLLPLYQYVKSGGKDKPVSIPLETHFVFRSGCRTKKRSTIVRQSREQIKRDLRHNELQKALYRRLVKKYGDENVGTENQGSNGTSIDLVVRRRRGYWFYEIKTAPCVRACVREALGQLLEYAFWPGAHEAARLIIAGERPMDQCDEDYLRCLRQRFSLPLEYERITI